LHKEKKKEDDTQEMSKTEKERSNWKEQHIKHQTKLITPQYFLCKTNMTCHGDYPVSEMSENSPFLQPTFTTQTRLKRRRIFKAVLHPFHRPRSMLTILASEVIHKTWYLKY
jgi:hypothetical protein